uniref:Uncharacterized protein n=1 Tax=Amphimedon queenslandica TaxID=400682 RepID=A0A1X7SKP8_AMPQE
LLSEDDPNTSVHLQCTLALPLNKELYEAAKRGDSTGVQSALSQGANVNYQNPEKYGTTSLHVAARGGYHDVVQILLSAGADVDLKDAVSILDCTYFNMLKSHQHRLGIFHSRIILPIKKNNLTKRLFKIYN